MLFVENHAQEDIVENVLGKINLKDKFQEVNNSKRKNERNIWLVNNRVVYIGYFILSTMVKGYVGVT